MAAGEQSREGVIGGLEHGLLVTRFHYTNAVQPKQVKITGFLWAMHLAARGILSSDEAAASAIIDGEEALIRPILGDVIFGVDDETICPPHIKVQ